MSWLIRGVGGLLVIAHGLVHMLYVSGEANSPDYPFTLKESWLVPGGARHVTGIMLTAATVGAFALVGLAVWGVPLLTRIWPILTIAAAGLSLALLVAFFDMQLLFGVAIDLALIVIAIWQPGWAHIDS